MDCISKKVKTAVLVTNTVKDRELEHFKKIYELIKDNGAVVRVPILYKEMLGERFDVTFCEESQLYREADAAVVLGGDGTILKAASGAIAEDCPILGVNLGRIGYMAEIGKDETEQIKRLFEGRYKISERMTLHVSVEDGEMCRTVCENALNDAVLRPASMGRVQALNVYSDGVRVSEHRGDGLIVSTPTGSTAYSMSAGGPVFDPSLECMCVTPVCSLSPAARPIVFSAECEIEIENADENAGGVFLSCDGNEGMIVDKHARIIVRRAQKKAKLISMGNEEFFNVLRKKIMSAM